MTPHNPQSYTAREQLNEQVVLFILTAALLSVVSDGWSGKPSPLLHQLLLLPCTVLLLILLIFLLRRHQPNQPGFLLSLRVFLVMLGIFQLMSVLFIFAEARHFHQFGYQLSAAREILAGVATVIAAFLLLQRSKVSVFGAVLILYATGALLSLFSFPLNYLRSDMLPVIGWADARLLSHLNPYGTMHVGTRVYDFPYLPGMLVAFLPAAAAHVDLRWANLVYLLTAAVLVYGATRADHRRAVTLLLAAFLLCPFLQYRHDIYLQPHWFAITVAVLLMQRKRPYWAAVLWGVSCAIYQLSWILLPFFFLHTFRKRGAWQLFISASLAIVGFLLIAGPFLSVASRQVGNNTVGQWNHLTHALADPINLSFWLTYLIKPSQLRWVQAAVLTGYFLFCFWRHRCISLGDTLRCMAIALATFIPLNVLVDGYFYLTLLWVLLLYICAVNHWWSNPGETQNEDGSFRLALETLDLQEDPTL